MDKSTYLRDAVLNWLRGQPFPDPPASLFVALSTADPGLDGAGLAEPAGGDYARLEVEGTTGRDLTAPVAVSGTQQVSNAAEWAWPPATDSWGTLTHAALLDPGGGLLYRATLTPAKAVGTSDTLRFPAGDLKFSES